MVRTTELSGGPGFGSRKVDASEGLLWNLEIYVFFLLIYLFLQLMLMSA